VVACGSDETVSLGLEADLKRIPAINTLDQTMGLDHGGIHPQFDLPEISQKFAVRNARVTSLIDVATTIQTSRSHHRELRSVEVGARHCSLLVFHRYSS
jgi:hypothetical protein